MKPDRRWLGLLTVGGVALLIVGVALAAFFIRSEGEPPRDHVCLPGEAGCPSLEEEVSAEQALAARYLPVLNLRLQAAPCDRDGAAFEPIPVEAVLENEEVLLRRAADGAVVLAGPSAADLYEQTEPTFLDFPGNPRRVTCAFERTARRFAEGQANVAYVRIAREPEYEGFALQYWFFYYFNDWNNKHEGDWEMIQIVFEEDTAADALESEPVRIAYSQHSGGEVARWDDRKVRREGSRPVVYVAVGSQANFFAPHVYLGRAEQGAGFGCDDASGPSRRLALDPRLMPDAPSAAADPFAWLAYTGRWGQLAGPEFDGPTGPNMKQQWHQPFSWEKRLRNSSVRVPSRDLVGTNAVNTFCTVVAVGSDLLLPIIIDLPLVATGALGAFGLIVLVSLTRTRYLPIQARPLRTRRRIGQILLSALEIYRRRLRTFLRIGLVFIPAGIILSLLHWTALDIASPLGPVVSVPHANLGLEVVLWFAMAELEFGLAYAVVIALATASIARIEANEQTSVAESLRELRRRLPHVLVARLIALAVVGLLAITVVGLPLALRQAVRWTFIEQAVLIDGRFGGAAVLQSSRAVGADSLWSAACVVSLSLLGLAVPAAVGIGLLLFVSTLPLFYVNLVASLLYVALVPYVAICLALVYFDLQARTGAAADTPV